MLDTTASENSVIDRVKTLVVPRVYEDSLPPTVPPVYPYIVYAFAEPFASPDGRNIVSERNNPLTAMAFFEIVSNTSESRRQIANKLRGALTGFRPVDGTEMRRAGFGGAQSSTSKALEIGTQLYTQMMTFTWRTNLSYNP